MHSTFVIKLANLFELNCYSLHLNLMIFHIQLQDEAACTCNCLDKCRGGGFEELFMAKVDFGAKFDSCLRYVELSKLRCITFVHIAVCTLTGSGTFIQESSAAHAEPETI